MPNIIERIEKSKDLLTVYPSRSLQDYIGAPLSVRSDKVDFSNCPDSVCALPLILNTAPILWRLGGEWEDEHVDSKLASSLDLARRTFSKLYPQYSFLGNICGQNNCPPREDHNGVAMLYSGGLDSSFSFFEHLEKKPLLLTIHGDLLEMGEVERRKWDHIRLSAGRLIKKFDVEHLSISSNFTEIFLPKMLELFPWLPVGYWAGVQHGLGFSGLAAPVMYAKGRTTLVIASSYSVDHSGPWGSHPFIEGVLEWNHGSVQHHGYSFSRVEKLEAVSQKTAKLDFAPQLLVCPNGERTTENCMQCSKCYRTLANILVANLDPEDFGFELDREGAFNLLKASIPRKLKITDNELYFWNAIKRDAQQRPEPEGLEGFMEWVQQVRIQKPMTPKIRVYVSRLVPKQLRRGIRLLLGKAKTG